MRSAPAAKARVDRHERAARGLGELFEYFDALVERAREQPGDDMVSRLLEPGEDGDLLSDLEIRRSPNPHLAFGRGVHTCIGALLARIEARVAIPAILARLPGIRLEEERELVWEDSLASRALHDLHVRHDA